MEYGALPPSDKAWQIGKSTATIKFVNDAEAFLSLDDDDIDYKFRSILKQQIKFAKDGNLLLLENIEW